MKAKKFGEEQSRPQSQKGDAAAMMNVIVTKDGYPDRSIDDHPRRYEWSNYLELHAPILLVGKVAIDPTRDVGVIVRSDILGCRG